MSGPIGAIFLISIHYCLWLACWEGEGRKEWAKIVSSNVSVHYCPLGTNVAWSVIHPMVAWWDASCGGKAGRSEEWEEWGVGGGEEWGEEWEEEGRRMGGEWENEARLENNYDVIGLLQRAKEAFISGVLRPLHKYSSETVCQTWGTTDDGE